MKSQYNFERYLKACTKGDEKSTNYFKKYQKGKIVSEISKEHKNVPKILISIRKSKNLKKIENFKKVLAVH